MNSFPKSIFSQTGCRCESPLSHPKALKYPNFSSFLLYSASHTSRCSSIQCKLKDNPLCYYLQYTTQYWSPSPPPALKTAHPQPIHGHLNLHLCIPNCQSNSNSWNILDVTIYGCRSDNISRPLWRTGTLQCALNNINSWKKKGVRHWQKSRLVRWGEKEHREGTQCSGLGGNWDHVRLPQCRD